MAECFSAASDGDSYAIDGSARFTHSHTHQFAARKVMGSPQIAPSKPTHRSRVTNGSAVLPDVDGRSTWVRRLRDLISAHVDDLGGDSAISEAERSIVRRAATLTVELERLEGRFAAAGQATIAELDAYQRAAGNLRRLLESVGLERRARNITPPLSEYVAAKARPS